MSKNILITGGAGFIGYHLAKSYFNDPRYFVLIVDNFSRGEKDDYFLKLIKESTNINYIESDLANMDENTENFIQSYKFEIIYHLAATNGTNNFYKNPMYVLENNIDSTKNLLNIIDSQICRKFIFASTCETYFGTINKFDGYLPTNESVPLCIDDIFNKRASYAISKIAGESMAINACNNKNIPFNIIRYHNVYGERMGKDGHVIPDIIKRIRETNQNEELITYGMYQSRAFMYIYDAIKDTRKVAKSNFNGEIFNVGIEKETMVKEIINRLIEFSGKEFILTDRGFPKGSVNRRIPDMNKFKDYFGKSKYTSLTEGLLKTYLWYNNDKK